jgi:hypothetical protein
LHALRRDYQAMRDMYLFGSEPAGFDDLLAILDDLEKRINQFGDG